MHFSTDDSLGVKKPEKTQISIVASPVGPYYATGFKPISLYCATESIRSAPKGTGAYKIGGYNSIYSVIMGRLLAFQAKSRQKVTNKFYGY